MRAKAFAMAAECMWIYVCFGVRVSVCVRVGVCLCVCASV